MALSDQQDTIVAICTPPGASGCGILRLSGPAAFAILDRLMTPVPAPITGWHCATATMQIRFRLPQTGVYPSTCPVVLYRMPAPRSYTREDVAEIHLPGSPPLLRAALRTVTEEGAQVADPGAFTLRAFLNGRIDLGQAESIERLITAESEAERRDALSRLDRTLTQEIASLVLRLQEALAMLEARIDFEEEEVEPLPPAFFEALEETVTLCARLGEDVGREVRQPPCIRIIGLTNAGKSSLFNALLGRQAAITSDTPTTTRDLLRHEYENGQMRLMLEDSPGIDTAHEAMAALASAHAIRHLQGLRHAVLAVDGSVPPPPALLELLRSMPPTRVILAITKADLPRRCAQSIITQWITENGHTMVAALPTSTATGEGLEALAARIEGEALGDMGQMFTGHCSLREAATLREAGEACRTTLAAAEMDLGYELLAEDLRVALLALLRTQGGGYVEEILDTIFSRFCIGK